MPSSSGASSSTDVVASPATTLFRSVERRGALLRSGEGWTGGELPHVAQDLRQHVGAEGEGWLQGERAVILVDRLVEPTRPQPLRDWLTHRTTYITPHITLFNKEHTIISHITCSQLLLFVTDTHILTDGINAVRTRC